MRSRSRWSWGGGAEVALGQPHHPLANAWFAARDGFNKNNPSEWGLYASPPPPPANWVEDVPLTADAVFFYVDKNHPNRRTVAHESNAIRGYPASPRNTLPHAAPAGSVIIVTNTNSNDPYGLSDAYASYVRVGGNGSQSKPVFVVGDPNSKKTAINWRMRFEGQYVVAQGFELADLPLGQPPLEVTQRHLGGTNFVPSHHIVIRDFDISAPREATGCDTLPSGLPNRSGISIYGVGTGDNRVTDVIIASSVIHDIGAWTVDSAICDHDEHGIGIGSYVSDVTIMNCTLFHCEGDGLQINDQVFNPTHVTQNIFAYRNKSYEHKQAGFWAKYARNVTFLENEVWSIAGSNSNPDGAGVGGQYGTEYFSLIGNTIRKCKTGILITSLYDGSPGLPPGTGGTGDGLVIADNEIREITRDPTDPTYVGHAVHLRDLPSLANCPMVLTNEVFNSFGGVAVSSNTIRPITAWGNSFCNIDAVAKHFDFERCESVNRSNFSGNVVNCPSGESLRVTTGCGPTSPQCPAH